MLEEKHDTRGHTISNWCIHSLKHNSFKIYWTQDLPNVQNTYKTEIIKLIMVKICTYKHKTIFKFIMVEICTHKHEYIII